jgi:glycosyltransferase involved in cell wall biosynthesis
LKDDRQHEIPKERFPVSVDISVIICAHNPRADYFEKALQALKAQTLSTAQWELLLVDNASTQSLAETIDLSWHPQGHHVREEQLGLTPARLCGIKAAQAEVLVFVDDDNVLDPNYLETALQISQNWTMLGAWGGQTMPGFEEQPPDWTKMYWGYLAIREFDRDQWSNLYQQELTPYGAGLCIRKAVATEYLRLVSSDPKRLGLGRKGAIILSGEDTDIAYTACDLGLGMGLFTSLKLVHLMSANRLSEDYLLRIVEGSTYSQVILESFRGVIPPNRSLPSKLLLHLRRWLMKGRSRRFHDAYFRGFNAASQVVCDLADSMSTSDDTKSELLVSIVINNYNYDRFLAEAIDSALGQTYAAVEVVVVDDGSTDRSREVIASYGDRIIPVLQQNAGQASAFNTGIEHSKGELVFFLDADDIFLPTKIAEMIEVLSPLVTETPDIMISNYVETIDEKSEAIDIGILDTLSATCSWHYLSEIRGKKLIEGGVTRLSTAEQAYRFAAKYRFIPYLAMPTSGFGMTRGLVNKVFPIPCKSVRISADDFAVKAASMLGSVYLTDRILTKYRIHGKNNWYGAPKKIKKDFIENLDDFLNSKLELAGRKPVFSYFNSIDAKNYYRANLGYGCDRELSELARKVISWHVNPTTIIFFLRTMLLSISCRVRHLNDNMKSSNP